MTIFWWVGIFVVSTALILGMLVRQHMRVRAGLLNPYSVDQHPSLLARRFFTKAHDLEIALIHVLHDGVIIIARFAYVYGRRFMRFILSWKYIRTLYNTVSGKKEIDSSQLKDPSAYLKDIAEHKDQVRNGGVK